MKFLRRIIEKHASRLINDHFAKSIKPRLSASRILQNRFVVGKRLMPLENSKGFYVIPKHPALSEPGLDGLPVPPQDLWEGYGKTPEQYLQLGREHTEQMIRILRAQGAAPDLNTKVLDFGCAAGRMLRFMPAHGNAGERWGVDLKAQTISWCQQYLSPPMLFAPCSTVPHLPFEDNYFDLVYAGSVFTHISDSPDTWFLELRRVVRKGGYLYLTIFDKHAHRVLQTKYRDRADLDLGWFVDLLERFNRETSALESDYGMFSFEGGNWGGFPVPQVGFDVDFLTDRWGRLARVASVNPEAYGYQTAVLFQKHP
jgi:SAM-dependent methyltransferase